MKTKNIINVLSIAVILGFVIGLIGPVVDIATHRYIQYGMFRTAAVAVQESWNRWTLFAVIALSHFYFILVIAVSIWKSRSHGGSKDEGRLSWAKRSEALKVNPVRITALVLVLLLVILNMGVAIDGKINAPKGPNVIFIVCETLRPDHLSFYGYRRTTTSNVDAFANNAFVFKNAYTSAPSTMPAVWNIVTSKYQSTIPAKDRYVTMAEYFKSRNYKTGAFLSHHYFEGTKSNLHQGFDVYDGDCEKDVHDMSARKAESITGATIKWIEQNKSEPFFAWLVYFDPHDPYVPPDNFRGHYNENVKFSGDRRSEGVGYMGKKNQMVSKAYREFLINAYDEEIRYFDHEVGELFKYLKSSGLYDNSIIVLTADHGEELGDNGKRWDHCQLLSQEEIWVPLLIKLPGQTQKKEIESLAQNIDIYPTLVEYFDKSDLPDYYKAFEGKSLIPLLNKDQLDDDRYAASFWHEQLCIVKGNYKYWMLGDKELLMNIKTGKRITDPKIRKELRNELGTIYRRYLTDEGYYSRTIENLKSIGYLQ